MSKKTIVVILILVLIGATMSAAKMRTGLGVGASIGAPFSFLVVGDYNFGEASATLSLGYKNLLLNQGYFDVALEGVYHLPLTILTSNDMYMFYPSVGGRIDLQFGSSTLFSIGPIFVLDYQVKDLPMRVFAKSNPNFTIGTGIFRLSMAGEVGAVWQF